MKSQSNTQPLKLQDLGNNTSHFNYNVVEGVNEDGDALFNYDQVTVSNPVSYGKLITALVRERYSIDDELSIQRQKNTKPSEFQEYFDFVEECKTLAKID